jgi:hypothetical protein
MTTTTPDVGAREIEAVIGAFGEPIPVTFSDETAHERVAIVRLQGDSGYHLAVWAVDRRGRGGWHLRPSAYRGVREALAMVSAVVATFHLS